MIKTVLSGAILVPIVHTICRDNEEKTSAEDSSSGYDPSVDADRDSSDNDVEWEPI